MEKEIVKNTLSDGSVVYDIIIDDTAGSGGFVILHCIGKDSADSLFDALGTHTVSF